jgi:predicted amidohydrolase
MRVAAVQFRPEWGKPELARAALSDLVRRTEGAALVVCPEMAVSGYVFASRAEVEPFCEPPEGRTFAALAPLARAQRAWLVCGFAESGGFNSALVIAPDGRLVAVYRKVLLYDADRTWARPGDRRLLVRAELGTFAVGICMDLNDDGFTGMLRSRRPGLLAFCTNWVDEGTPVHPYWRARLAGWGGTMVAANRWGEERGTRFSGRSAVMRDGEVLGEAGAEGDGVVAVEV